MIGVLYKVLFKAGKSGCRMLLEWVQLVLCVEEKKNVFKRKETNTRTCVSSANCNTSGDMCLLLHFQNP